MKKQIAIFLSLFITLAVFDSAFAVNNLASNLQSYFTEFTIDNSSHCNESIPDTSISTGQRNITCVVAGQDSAGRNYYIANPSPQDAYNELHFKVAVELLPSDQGLAGTYSYPENSVNVYWRYAGDAGYNELDLLPAYSTPAFISTPVALFTASIPAYEVGHGIEYYYTVSGLPQTSPGLGTPVSSNLVSVKTEEHSPVVIIPGIYGSELKIQHEQSCPPPLSFLDCSTLIPYWISVPTLGTIDRYAKLTLDPSSLSYQGPSIKVGDIVRDVNILDLPLKRMYSLIINSLISAGYHEQPLDISKTNFLDQLNGSTVGGSSCNAGKFGKYSRVMMVNPYDWRINNSINAGPFSDLQTRVECLRRAFPDQKVTIIAHSMGGLITEKMLENYAHPEAVRMIGVANPWYGAPQASNVLLSGDSLHYDPFPIGIIGKNVVLEMGPFMDSAWELLPNAQYFATGARPFVELTADADGDGKLSTYTTNTQYDALFKYARGYTRNISDVTSSFFDSNYYTQKPSEFYSLVANDETPTKGPDTFGSVKAVKNPNIFCRIGSALSGSNCVPSATPTTFQRLAFTSGDGTVPIISSCGMKSLNDSIITKTYNADHQGIMKDSGAINDMLSIVTGHGLPGALPSGCGTYGTASRVAAAATPVSNPSQYIEFYGDTDFTYTDSTGAHFSTKDQPMVTPDYLSLYHPLGNAWSMIVPVNITYTITFADNKVPLAVDVNDSDANTLERFTDIPAPTGSPLIWSGSPSSTTTPTYTLHYQNTPTTNIQPAVVPVTSVGDTTPPVVTATQVPEDPDHTMISLSATDPSGVKQIIYSVNNGSPIIYTDPFTVNPTDTLQVSAEDNALNISDPQTITIEKYVAPTAKDLLTVVKTNSGGIVFLAVPKSVGISSLIVTLQPNNFTKPITLLGKSVLFTGLISKTDYTTLGASTTATLKYTDSKLKSVTQTLKLTKQVISGSMGGWVMRWVGE